MNNDGALPPEIREGSGVSEEHAALQRSLRNVELLGNEIARLKSELALCKAANRAFAMLIPLAQEVAEMDSGEQECIASEMGQKLAILRLQHPEAFQPA